MKIKDLVAPGKMVTFVCFDNNLLWYVTDCGFTFPVPVADITGEAELLPTERAMSLMKWMNKHLKFLEGTPNKMVRFVRFKHNLLWYVTDDGFEFPVPVADITGEAKLLSTEHAMSLMKWMNKHLKYVESAKAEQA